MSVTSKPYLSFTDSHADAKNGFADEKLSYKLEVDFPEELLKKIPEEKQSALLESLALDPRPAYHNDPEFPYGFAYGGFDIRFRVNGMVLAVFDVLSPQQESTPVK